MSEATFTSTKDRFIQGDLPFEEALAEISGTEVTRNHLWKILENLATQQHGPALSAHDADILDEAAFTANPAATAAAHVDRDIRMQRLVGTALSIPEAAERLGVTTARIRQLIAEQKLWAFSSGRNRLFPPAQFSASGLVPHLDRIIPLLEVDLHPLTVQALLTTPQQHLIVEGNPVSIVTWLTGCAGTEADINLAASIILTAPWESV